MTDEPRDNEQTDQPLSGYLSRWGEAMRRGSAQMPVPRGRSDSPSDVFAAADTARGATTPPGQTDQRLLSIAAEAETTGFRPWEEGVSHDNRGRVASGLLGRGRWLLAVAAVLPVALGVGLWRLAESTSARSLRGIERSMSVNVGYHDFGDTARGVTGLRAGSAAKVFFSLSKPGFYSLLLLDQNLSLSVEKANRSAEVGRHEVDWHLPADAAPGVRETILVLFSHDAIDDPESLVQRLAGKCSSSRPECLQMLIDELRRAFSVAVGHHTYTVAGQVP